LCVCVCVCLCVFVCVCVCVCACIYRTSPVNRNCDLQIETPALKWDQFLGARVEESTADRPFKFGLASASGLFLSKLRLRVGNQS
jgi:hypothetical protein